MMNIVSEPPKIVFQKYRAKDRDWVTTVNVRHYTTVEKFDASFAGAVVVALELLEARMNDETSHFLIAEEDGQSIGCVFFSAGTPTTGRIRLFYLDEVYRGRGTGKRILNRIIEGARATGFDRIRVSTFDRHVEACGLYASLGFRGTTGDPVIAFGQRMRQVDFEARL